MSITTECQEVFKDRGMDRSGIPEKYWSLVEQYREELIGQAFAILGSMEDAEDVVQETFCEALRDAEKLSGESVGASLRMINKTNALDRLRSTSRAKKRMEHKQQNPTRAFTTGGFSNIELQDTMQNALQTLPANLRAVVELRYWKHLSYKEISAQLGIPIGAVGPLLSEAGVRLYPRMAGHLKSASGAAGSQAPARRKGSRRLPGEPS